MRWNTFYTIKELDYKAIEKNLSASNLSPDFSKQIESLINDHRAMVECRNKLLKQQEQTCQGLFGIFAYDAAKPEENKPKDLSSTETPNENESNSTQPDSEKNNPEPNPEPTKPKDKKSPKKGSLPKGNVIKHELSEEEKKCPCCGGKMHMQRSTTKTLVLALPSFTTETHVAESCRCLTCDTSNTAPLPKEFEHENIGRYHYSVIAALASLRYENGVPSFRIEHMSDMLGLKISDSTQWYLFEESASILRSFVDFLIKTVANAKVQHVDDSHNFIIDLVRSIEKQQENALRNGQNPDSIRSGIHTTNVTGVFPEGQIIIYKTGLHHAGEILAKILSARTVEDKIILMADAATAIVSKIKELDKIVANCNSHANRKFKELAESEIEAAKQLLISEHKISESIDFFLFRYKTIFENDKKTRDMSPSERLLFHNKNSLPLMEEMQQYATQALLNKKIEPNSSTGKTYQYFLNHYPKLCAFCIFENAPICNNLAERMLKGIIRHRKNSLFFKNQLGAKVGDIMSSILFTAKANDLNSIEYMRNLLIHQALWKSNPAPWLPWNYKKTIAELNSKAAT